MNEDTGGSVKPKSWEGSSNPLTQPGVERRPVGRPRKDGSPPQPRTAAGMGSEGTERPTGASPGKPGEKSKRRKNATRPETDYDIAWAEEPPSSDLPEKKEKDVTTRRLSVLQDQAGKWMRLRVFASKSGANDVSRQVARSGLHNEKGRFHRAYYIEGVTEARLVARKISSEPEQFEYEVWARFTPAEPEAEPPL